MVPADQACDRAETDLVSLEPLSVPFDTRKKPMVNTSLVADVLGGAETLGSELTSLLDLEGAIAAGLTETGSTENRSTCL